MSFSYYYNIYTVRHCKHRCLEHGETETIPSFYYYNICTATRPLLLPLLPSRMSRPSHTPVWELSSSAAINFSHVRNPEAENLRPLAMCETRRSRREKVISDFYFWPTESSSFAHVVIIKIFYCCRKIICCREYRHRFLLCSRVWLLAHRRGKCKY